MFTAIIPIKKSKKEQLEILEYDGETLLERKINVLKRVRSISEIIVASDNINIKEYAHENEAKFYLRNQNISYENSFSSLFEDVVTRANNNEIIWSFATTPFINEIILNKSIEKYLNLDFEIFDSLITCSKLNRFILDENGPLNFWTGTRHQNSKDLPALYMLINGYFIMSKELNLKYRYPWGKIPAKECIDRYTGFEIKDKRDFEIFTKVYIPGKEKI